jgi:hypothetical protein
MARRSSSRIRAAQALRFEGLRSTELPAITESRRRRYSSIDGKESIQSVENRSISGQSRSVASLLLAEGVEELRQRVDGLSPDSLIGNDVRRADQI